MRKTATDLTPGDSLRGIKGPRTVLRTRTRTRLVEILTRDADGELRYSTWFSETTVNTLEKSPE